MFIQTTGPDIRKNQDPTYITGSNHHHEESTGHTNKRRNKTPIQEKKVSIIKYVLKCINIQRVVLDSV
jgi:hypothetical protein